MTVENLLLVEPARVRANLVQACAALGLTPPTDWQLCLGVLRLWHRVVFRSDTVGTSRAGIVRDTPRARLLAWRALRLPFLLAERAVAPLDFTGFASPPARLIRHLLAAHHDDNQFVYDLELLAAYGKLDELRAEVAALIERDGPRDRWLRDLAVFAGYHESLLAAIDAFATGRGMTDAEAGDPDITLRGYLRWCAEQPTTPAATLAAWRAGTFRFDSPLRQPGSGLAVRFAQMSPRELAERFAAGKRFDPQLVAGSTYRGTSLGLPAWVERLAWKQFAKVFDRTGGGHNLRIEQDGLERPWRPRLRHGRPIRFGEFAVVERAGDVILDYSAGRGGLRALRDPLVALDDTADTLLGRSLVQLGPATIATPSYFLLERDATLPCCDLDVSGP